MPISRYLAAAAALGLSLPAAGPARAGDVTVVDEIISIGTRSPGGIRAGETGGSVTVIDAGDLQARQTRLVADVLRDVPGFAVSRSGGAGGFTQVRVRGFEANHVLMLIDGVEAADPFLGQFDFAALLADEVARIEILRGAQSALYGSDAVTGVINYVVPTGAEAPGTSARIEAGSFDTFGGAARLAGVSDAGLDYVVSAAHQSIGGFPGQSDGLGTRDLGSQNSALNAKLAWPASENLTLRGVLRLSASDGDTNDAPFPDSLIVDTPGMGYEATSLTYGLGADYTGPGGWSHSLSVQGLEAVNEGFAGGGRNARSEGQRFKASYVGAFAVDTGGAVHALTGAIDHERETFQNVISAFGADTTRRSIDNTGLVAQYDLRLGQDTGLGAAVRHDENDVFDNAVTWRAHAWRWVGPSLRLRTAAGTGIKNPSQTELFGFNAALFPFVGNPNLKPEESESWEVGADILLSGGRGELSLTWFDSTLQNEIYSAFGGFDLAPDCPAPPLGQSTTCNRPEESQQQGLELALAADLTDTLDLNFAYTWLDAEEGGFEEIRRAPHIASLNLDWRSRDQRLGATLSVRYNGKQQDTNFSILTPDLFAGDPDFTELPAPFGRVELPAYTLVNLAGDYRLSDRVEMFGRVENLLDEDYYEVITYRSAGATAYVGVRGRF
jgi:vitamin B12 transporter